MMNELLNPYPTCDKAVECSPSQRPLRDSLVDMRASFQSRINDLDAAIKALEENPKIVEVLDTLRKVKNW